MEGQGAVAGNRRILVIGGYGAFGGRVVELLETCPGVTLIVAGRSAAKAAAFCKARDRRHAELVHAAFDRQGDLDTQLAALHPDLVIDASGPFQDYGRDPYRVVRACISAGADYMDLADGRDFVAGVAEYDAEARQAGVFVISGVSSFPVLSAAAVRRLSEGMSRVRVIRGGIAPSPFARVGPNVIRAIAGYAGQPVRLRRGGAEALGHPFTDHVCRTIHVPGHDPLPEVMFSLVDVPDLRVLAEEWPEAETVWMGAGTRPAILHHALALMSYAVRLRLLPSLLPLAPVMHLLSNHLGWGRHRGGMFVEVVGRDADRRPLKRTWHMVAEGDDGPLIPAMAVEGIVHRMLRGQPPEPGARAALRELELDDYERLFSQREIFSAVRED